MPSPRASLTSLLYRTIFGGKSLALCFLSFLKLCCLAGMTLLSHCSIHWIKVCPETLRCHNASINQLAEMRTDPVPLAKKSGLEHLRAIRQTLQLSKWINELLPHCIITAIELILYLHFTPTLTKRLDRLPSASKTIKLYTDFSFTV